MQEAAKSKLVKRTPPPPPPPVLPPDLYGRGKGKSYGVFDKAAPGGRIKSSLKKRSSGRGRGRGQNPSTSSKK